MKFKVIGQHAVAGVEPGKTGDTDNAAWAAWATQAGHIEIVPTRTRPDKDTKGKEAADVKSDD